MSLVSFGGSATIVSDSAHTHTLTRAFSRKYCELVLCVFGYRYIQSTTQCVCVCVCVCVWLTSMNLLIRFQFIPPLGAVRSL